MDQTTQEALTGYVRDLFAPEDEALRGILQASEARGLPQIHVKSHEGQMLQFLIKAVGARRAVEIGTLGGYSGTWIARALPADGKLITLDNNPDHAEVARESFKRAGVADRVEVRLGDAKQSLAALAKDGPYDAVFIDADRPSYTEYLAWGIDHVRPGGLIAAHNALLADRWWACPARTRSTSRRSRRSIRRWPATRACSGRSSRSAMGSPPRSGCELSGVGGAATLIFWLYF